MNNEAKELNSLLKKEAPVLLDLLSEDGKCYYFPKKGLLMQTQEAKKCSLNATVGMAYENDGSPICLSALEEAVALEREKIFTYAPSAGIPELRKIWREGMTQKNPSLDASKISNPLVVNALTHGLTIAGRLFVDKGDEIILPDLNWPNYRLLFEVGAGARLSTYPFFSDGEFNIEGLREMLNKPGDKKIVLLNFPNNPTGYSLKLSECEEVKNVFKETAEKGKKIVVLCDDAYWGMTHEEGVMGESIFAILASLHPNILAVKADGATKEDFVWGFRIGFLTFGSPLLTESVTAVLEEKGAGAIRGTISSASRLSQELLLKLYSQDDYPSEVHKKRQIIKNRYHAVKKVFEDNEKYREFFQPLPNNSGYFLCVKLSGVSADDARRRLRENYDTGVISFGDSLLRLAYSTVADHMIEKLFENLYNACKDVASGKSH